MLILHSSGVQVLPDNWVRSLSLKPSSNPLLGVGTYLSTSKSGRGIAEWVIATDFTTLNPKPRP